MTYLEATVVDMINVGCVMMCDVGDATSLCLDAVCRVLGCAGNFVFKACEVLCIDCLID